MNRRMFVRSAFLLAGSRIVFARGADNDRQVLVNGKLTSIFHMDVDDSAHGRPWLSTDDDHLKLSYPQGLDWGAMFVTWGKARAKNTPLSAYWAGAPGLFIDMSMYKSLIIEMRGVLGGEAVDIGIKTIEQPDDGSETKVHTPLTAEWNEYTFPLTRFKGASPAILSVVAEFVFAGAKAQTVLVRNIKYSQNA